MTALRSFAFQVLFYANLVAHLIVFSPVFFFLPEASCWKIVKNWARSSLWLLRCVAGTRSVIRGQENLPSGAFIVAAKHQSFWETFALVPQLPRPTFILKKELMRIPLFGAYCRRMGMIPIDRQRRGAVMSAMLDRASEAMAQGRQIIIFPEGTRTTPGAEPNYRPGIHFLYAGLNVPVVPVALNAGLFWPRQAFLRRPGTITAEFLPAIAPGMEREQFLALLRDVVEEKSWQLIREAYATQPDLPANEFVARHLQNEMTRDAKECC
ncbi:1-acyl-sn-glycerol-3-phosphate acyltransferase [Aureimonas fodinaquatilis]|uniref:1-acyl-sn-glycerol-3-phosphate acyltransferase n=1 Tax=Aureimonas fodinaquatilis TaxID=2565783 RepID=A0A5B0DRH0_9HYPH|nr:lysophospholipid acyltransferase family protein [Aureimonas fodinaquatilis]KAA0968592.1 1-acyl-sn-glycerol-3-phosphate acyltransferase [Aureimonas fodinaquatilis]